MAAKLQELAREACSSDAALWRGQAEQTLLQTTALARFLSYLGFAFAEGPRCYRSLWLYVSVPQCQRQVSTAQVAVFVFVQGTWVLLPAEPSLWTSWRR